MPIGPHTRLAALIGDPIEHSFSPLIHNTAYRLQGVDAVYLAIRVTREDLRDAVAGLRALGALGINVTIPHKRDVLPLLDEVRSDAKMIGAVNTIVLQHKPDGVRLVGENTDVTGFLAPLAAVRESIHGAPVVILGAGGAARAVLYACQTALSSQHVTVVARNLARAERTVRALAANGEEANVRILPFEDAGKAVQEATLIVNTTPVGMYPDDHATPWPRPEMFHPGQVVYDVVYNPAVTRLLHDAESRGAGVVHGAGMLLEQAAAAHMLWTGLKMPVEEVREAIGERLGPVSR